MSHTIKELLDIHKTYKIRMSDKTVHTVNGEDKRKIILAPQQFIELPSGDVINKSFIVGMTLDKEETLSNLEKLPEEEKLKAFASKDDKLLPSPKLV